MARDIPHPPRSPKAGHPPASSAVKRRGKSARTAVRKDTMILEAARGPRVLWGRCQPKIKKS